jgi:hypothetical protein
MIAGRRWVSLNFGFDPKLWIIIPTQPAVVGRELTSGFEQSTCLKRTFDWHDSNGAV